MLDRANFSSPPLYRRGFELFTLIGRHKVHRKAQSKMSQQALTQTPRREERAATLSSPAPSRRAVGGRGNRTARLLHTPAMRRATPRVPAPPGMPLLRHMDDPASHLSLKAASVYSTDQARYRYRIEGGKRASSLPTPHRKTWPSPRPSTALPSPQLPQARSPILWTSSTLPFPTRLRPSAPRHSHAVRAFARRSWAAPSNPLARERFAAARASSASTCRSL